MISPQNRLRLDAMIQAVCPIIGTSGELNVLRIDFAAGVTPQQQAAAQAVVASFDPSPAAQSQWEADQNPDKKDLLQSATQAIADIDTYLAIASPSNAQVVAAVRRLAQIEKQIIKRLIQVQ